MACADWSAVVRGMLGWWISSGICAAVQVWYQGVSACLCYSAAHPSHLLFLLLYFHQSGMRKRGITTFFIAGLSVSLPPSQPLAATSSPQLERALFCLQETDGLHFVSNQAFFCTSSFWEAKEWAVFGVLDSLLSPGLQMYSTIGIILNDV